MTAEELQRYTRIPCLLCEMCEDVARPRDFLCPPCRARLDHDLGMDAYFLALQVVE